MTWVAVALTMCLVTILLVGERSGRMAVRAPAKIAASAVFVGVGLLRYGGGHSYGAWLVLGLVLGAAGDVLLLVPGGLFGGLAVFFLGHVSYLVAFHTLTPVHAWPLNMAVPVVIVSAVVVNGLWPHLGKLRWAVLGYVTVISMMVWGAAATAVRGDVMGWVRLAGAVLFYVSDVFVARDRFVAHRFSNRAWGLPLYYAGQLMLAFTVGAASS